MRHRADSLLGKFRALVATIGFWNACLYATSRLVARLFGNGIRIVKYYFVAQPVQQPATPVRAGTGTFSLEFVDKESAMFAQSQRPPQVIAARFAQGARCLAATDAKGDLAGFLWFVIGPYDEDEVRARFVPKPERQTAWDFDVTIAPRYRMGRLFKYLWERASTELWACGVRYSVSRISAFNGASLASHRRLGARVVGQATFLCVGHLQLMKSTLSPRWHLSWRDRQRPVLDVEALSSTSDARQGG